MANTPKKVLFIDRDGTLIFEPPLTYQIDTLEQLEFLPNVIRNLNYISQKTDFELVMVTNQDGLGTDVYPQKNFDVVQSKLLQTLKNEGIEFKKIFIDISTEDNPLPTRKPGIAMLTEFFSEEYDLKNSLVIGDRLTDVKLAQNLGCKAIFFNSDDKILGENGLSDFCTLQTDDWNRISEFLFAGERKASLHRKTNETDVFVELNLSFNHMC